MACFSAKIQRYRGPMKNRFFICITFEFFINRIKIYVPEHIKHVHHHHVKKVPVYIVTKERPRVMHATHIEDDFADLPYRRAPRTAKTHPVDYDDVAIQGIYKGDESHVHEDISDDGSEYATVVPPPPPRPETTGSLKLPYMLRGASLKQPNRSLLLPQPTGGRQNRLKTYGE